MATRYEARYSPHAGRTANAAQPAPRRRPARHGVRLWFLSVAPVPLLFRALGGDPIEMARHLAAFAALELAVWLTREGLRAEEAWHARRIARRPAIPRKIFGAVLTGLGVAAAAFAPGTPAWTPAGYGLIALALHLAAFGLDPMRDKGLKGAGRAETERVRRAVEEAEGNLSALLAAARRTGDADILSAAGRAEAAVTTMLHTIEDDPRDLTAARKHLSVYLDSARAAAEKYAAIADRAPDPAARAEFLELLDELAEGFGAATTRLLEDDRLDLDVEIELLRERLARDGATRTHEDGG